MASHRSRLAAAVVLAAFFGLTLTAGTTTSVMGVSAGVAAATSAGQSVLGLGRFPVTCESTVGSRSGAGTTTCLANDPTASEKQSCATIPTTSSGTGWPANLCTDYGPLKTAMKNAGAPPTGDGPEGTDPSSINFGCQFADVQCEAMQSIGQNVGSWVAQNIANVFDATAFNTSSTLWSVATNMSGFWWTIIGFFVLGAGAIGMTAAAITGKWRLFLRAIIGVGGTFAATFTAIYVLGKVLNIVDGLDAPILAFGTSSGGFQQTIMKLMVPPSAGAGSAIAGGFSAVIAILALAGGLVVLAFVNSIRDLGLEVLVAFAPLAFALLGLKIGGLWVRRWVSAVFALVITKPLTLGLVVLSMNGAGAIGSLYTIQALPILIGFFMSFFMPFVAFGMFSFIGGAAAGATEAIGQRMGSHAKAAGRTAMRSARSTTGSLGASGGRGASGRPGASARTARPASTSAASSGSLPSTTSTSTSTSAAGTPSTHPSQPAAATPSTAPGNGTAAPGTSSGAAAEEPSAPVTRVTTTPKPVSISTGRFTESLK